MYKVTYKSENGREFVFDAHNKVIFDMDLGNGISVDLGTSQGFSQVGNQVDTQSIEGKNIEVNGVLFGDIYNQKVGMRKVFLPMTKGKLIFQDGHYIDVYVKETPTFATVKNDGKFSMLLYAPYPFFKSANGQNVNFSVATKMFKLPKLFNYTDKFYLGKTVRKKKLNIVNDGDVAVPFNVKIVAKSTCSNISINNLNKFTTIKFNITLNADDILELVQSENGTRLFLTSLTQRSNKTEVTYAIDEASTLFTLDVGDNVISAIDEDGNNDFDFTITYDEGVVSVYEY